MGFEKYDWKIEQEDAGDRIDKFLSTQQEDWSRSQVQMWIADGHVMVNEQPVKANYRLNEDDEIVVTIPPLREIQVEPENLELNVIYEDEDVIVLNKPRGTVVHPAPGHYSGTLVNGLLHHCKDLSGINGMLRPGIVHRIDKDTSGVIVVAKNDRAHLSLAEQLKDHTVTRKYVAIVQGNITHDLGTVDAPIGRDPKDRQSMTVVRQNSKHAVTHFNVKERFGDYTLIELKLETGRTHQIRVHMQSIGHPVVGDPKYGSAKSAFEIDGQALHAETLGFNHPRTNKYVEFHAPIPEDMERIIFKLKNM